MTHTLHVGHKNRWEKNHQRQQSLKLQSLATLNRVKCSNNAQNKFYFFGGGGGGRAKSSLSNECKSIIIFTKTVLYNYFLPNKKQNQHIHKTKHQ